MRREVFDQFGTMAGALCRLTEGIDLQVDAAEAEIIPQAGTHQDLFAIDVRAGKAQ